MRKLLTLLCLVTFAFLQYGKVISYWHCRVAAPNDCDCAKQLTDHPDSGHTHTPLLIAKEKSEEVYLYHAIVQPVFSSTTVIETTATRYLPIVPADHSAAIFQPPRCLS